MTFQVVVTQNAKSNLRHYYERAAAAAPETAFRWLARFHTALATLSELPQRCPFAPENDAVDEEIRQLIFGRRVGTYRVLFSIADREVRILHIRRAAMGVAAPEDLNS